jgi:hypothetical protein
MFQRLIPAARCVVLLSTILLGVSLVLTESSAQAQILRWEIEATVVDMEDPDEIFPDVRLGDPVRGFLSYDLSTPHEDDPEYAYYEHDPATFDVAGMVIENPRDETEIAFVPQSTYAYIDVYNDWFFHCMTA